VGPAHTTPQVKGLVMLLKRLNRHLDTVEVGSTATNGTRDQQDEGAAPRGRVAKTKITGGSND
jgi:hypothetical protein